MVWTVWGSNPGGGEIFRTRPDRLWGLPSLLHNGYRVFFGGKAAGVWSLPHTPSSAEVKERVKLYLYSTYGPPWRVLLRILPLPLPLYIYFLKLEMIQLPRPRPGSLFPSSLDHNGLF